MEYIWQRANWPNLTWQSGPLLPLVSRARLAQGGVLNRLGSLGFPLLREARAEIMTEESVMTAAIEGERLSRGSVRSSVARRLGLPTAGLPPPDRAADGLVDVLMDATQHYNLPLTAARLKRWQRALFPTGYSGLTRVRAGAFRGAKPMRVVSGPAGREKIHFEAPPAERLPREIRQFLIWWKSSRGREDGLLRAGLAHFYFVTIHPFEDGNGRIARALTDMALAQDENLAVRCYSMSSRIMHDRDGYYRILERTQRGNGDVTDWLAWFLQCHLRAVEQAGDLAGRVLAKAEFWRIHASTPLSERQRKVINRMLDAGEGGFEGGLTTRKYVSLTRASRVTAYREIAELVAGGILRANKSTGRSASYDLAWEKFSS